MVAFDNGQWTQEIAGYDADGENVIEHSSRLPTHDEIEVRAYEIFLRNGGHEGHSDEDWLEAERELMEEMHHGAEESVTGTLRDRAL